MKNVFRIVVMFLVGFCTYITIEVLYRGYSFPMMGVMSGIIFILIDHINNHYGWNMELCKQCLIGGVYATLAELIFGLIDKCYLHWNMWDYSNEFLNFYGVICPKFSLYWCALALIAILVADFVNYCIYRSSQRPYYIIFGHKWEPRIYNILD